MLFYNNTSLCPETLVCQLLAIALLVRICYQLFYFPCVLNVSLNLHKTLLIFLASETSSNFICQ